MDFGRRAVTSLNNIKVTYPIKYMQVDNNLINQAIIQQGYQAFLAPAKINLFLHIVGKRDDGYHLLQTVFQLLDFYDTIYLKVNNNGIVTRNQQVQNINAEDDLCVRAALALKQYAINNFLNAPKQYSQLGVDIAYDKRIPMGGGLGGGSSDAASVLIALNQLWELNLSNIVLMQLALSIGADVPVFVFGQNAWAEGIGEVLQTIELPITYYVVITPQTHVATAEVFKRFNANKSLTKYTNPKTIAGFSRQPFSDDFKNDLEQVVCEDYEPVSATLNWLKQFGDARMSGSGASLFVAVNSEVKAKEILQKKPINTLGFVAKSLKYHPLYEMNSSK